MKRVAFVPLLLALGIGTLALAFARPPAPCREGCNVILIMMDTLSARHLESHGYARETLPRTTAFFEKRGVVFEQATANASWTLPSFNTLYFSALAPDISYADLEGGRPTLQQSLRDAGVTVRAVIPPRGFFITDIIAQAFDETEMRENDTDHLTLSRAREELSLLETSTTPFFLLAHSFEVHDPYEPTTPYNELFSDVRAPEAVTMSDILRINNSNTLTEETARAFELRYDQGIAQADANVANFLESISAETLEDTVIILSSDHGEAFGEHGHLWHSFSLYEEEVHIPLMMYVPHTGPKRIKETVSHLDLAPTILELAGALVPKAFEGASLVPLLRGDTLGTRIIPLINGMPYYLPEVDLEAPIVANFAQTGALGSKEPLVEPTAYAVRRGMEKLMYTTSEGALGELLYFNLDADPREMRNLIDEGREPPTDLLRALEALAASYPIVK